MVRSSVLLACACVPVLLASCQQEPNRDAQPKPQPSASVVASASAAPAIASSVVLPASSLALPSDDLVPPAASAAVSASAAQKPPKAPAPTTPAPKASASATALASAFTVPAPPASLLPTASASSTAPPRPEAIAGDPAANALAERSDRFYMPLQNLTVRFKQEFYIQSTGKKKASSGTMKFQRPGKMSWRYDPPNGNLVVCDGTTVSVYEAEGRQYTQQPFQNSEYAGALGFLSGEGIRKYFTFRFHEVNNFPGGKVLLGTPKTANPGYTLVLFYVDDATAHIRRVVIVDAQRNRNRFDLESLSEGPIDPREFVWAPPAGATLIAH